MKGQFSASGMFETDKARNSCNPGTAATASKKPGFRHAVQKIEFMESSLKYGGVNEEMVHFEDCRLTPRVASSLLGGLFLLVLTFFDLGGDSGISHT